MQKHLSQLEQGYIHKAGKNRKRAIHLIQRGGQSIALRLAGTVAAGNPIEPVEKRETAYAPREMLGSGEYFALKVKGDSMIDEGIHEGDTIVVRRQSTASNDQTVVVLVNGAFEIRGIVVGLMRKYD